jgi:hypothetical protein
MSKKTITFELSILERLFCIPALFPQEANKIEYIHKNNIEKKIEIGSEEAALIDLKSTENGGSKWDQSKAKQITIELTHLERDFLSDQADKILKKMDDDESFRLPTFVLDFIYKKLKA